MNAPTGAFLAGSTSVNSSNTSSMGRPRFSTRSCGSLTTSIAAGPTTRTSRQSAARGGGRACKLRRSCAEGRDDRRDLPIGILVNYMTRLIGNRKADGNTLARERVQSRRRDSVDVQPRSFVVGNWEVCHGLSAADDGARAASTRTHKRAGAAREGHQTESWNAGRMHGEPCGNRSDSWPYGVDEPHAYAPKH